jgi:Domain of unknown function (DUF5666)
MTEPHVPTTPTPTEEPNEVAFEAHVTRSTTPGRSVRTGIVLGSALLFVVGAMAVMGASPSPSTAPGASAAPGTSSAPDLTKDGRGPGHLGGIGFERGGFGRGGITITAISGSSLSLKTDDGWTRTIAVTSATTITRLGETIAIGDLKVGDTIGLRQERATDGTYSITAIDLVLPKIAGQVTAVDGSTITVKQFDGTTATIHVASTTTYAVGDKSGAALSDVTVDSFVVASGTTRADGSLDAEVVRGGAYGRGGDGGPGRHGWPGGPMDLDPNPTPAPSTTPG